MDTKSLLRRCRHDVFMPERIVNEPNDCCSVCCPMVVALADCKHLIIKNAETGRWEDIKD